MTEPIDREPITVLEVTTPPDGTTRYIDQIVTLADASVRFAYFSWKRALTGSFDVLHVHWPENLVRDRSQLRQAVRPLLLLLLIARLKLGRIPIVRTLHNLDPHESGSWIERRALAALDRATDVFVTINPVTRAPRGIEVSIPHGHYRDRFSPHPKATSEAGTLTYAGLIRPYKGVERLIEAFEELPRGVASRLRIVGNPTPRLRKIVDAACARNPLISAELAFVPDSSLVEELTRAELVCLPYDEMHNSGMALVGLSLDRPILVPDTATTRALSNEVGEGWIHRFQPPLTADQLRTAIETNRAMMRQRESRPRLEDRDWALVSSRYEEAFRLALRNRKKP